LSDFVTHFLPTRQIDQETYMEEFSGRRRQLLEQVLQRRKAQDTAAREGARPAAKAARLPASFAQESLWFLHKLAPVGSAYNIAMGLRLTGALDIVALDSAFAEMIRRHEALRTRFEETEGGIVQVIEARQEFRVAHRDLSALEESLQETEVASLLDEQARTAFSLARGPLIRVTLLKLSSRRHVLLIVVHHIVSDAWSMGVLTREIGVLYTAFSRGEPAPLPELELQYADYSEWQRQWLQGDVLEPQLNYWRTQLAGAPGLLELPTDRPRASTADFSGATVPVSLSAGLSSKLVRLSRKERATLFMVLLAAFQALLSRWSGQRDLVVGSPVAGRTLRQSEDLLGCFVNMLPLRSKVPDSLSFREFLRQVRATALDAYSNQDIPFEKLVSELRPERDLSRQPIFQVAFVLLSHAGESPRLADLELSALSGEGKSSKYDLTLSLQDTPEGIQGFFEYATAQFDRDTIVRLARHFAVFLEGIAENPDSLLWQLPLMQTQERERMLVQWNRTEREYEPGRCVHELFEEQVERTPDAVAVTCEGHSLSYRQLNSRANQLARYLGEHGVAPDQPVGICAERSLEMVIGLLGILKSGGAYVPVDPGYPAERVRYMLEDAAPRVVLIQEHLRNRLPQSSAQVIALDTQSSEIVRHRTDNRSARELGLTDHHLAYVIYTSGSTGRPKGAMNEHRGVVNRLRWMQDQYGLGAQDRVLQKTPFSFDISVWEFFWTLMSGASLVMARPQGHKDASYLRQLIDRSGVTTLHFVPAMLQSFLDEIRVGQCPSLRHVVCAGEELAAPLQRRCFELLPQVRLSNLYGPTEAAVDVTAWDCRRGDQQARVPIGRPISNIQVYVLDAHRQPVPVGVAGELYIGGIGVSRGYLRRPGLTAERFVSSPFDRGRRLYRTGDRARYLADGNLEFLGRIDQQVKIRGFRIEPGEIEMALVCCPGVDQAVVVAREVAPGDRQLVAYVVPSSGATLPPIDELRAHLGVSLPDYMVPALFVELDTLPLTPSGKLDRNALPAPQGRLPISDAYVAPRTPTEELLVEIWEEVLQLPRVGVHDNFFELGGHSLLTMKIVAKIHARTRISLPVWTLFQSPSVASLAMRLGQHGGPGSDAAQPEFQLEEQFEGGVI
jgi:amino acid adenylation domain-containing protein